MTLFFFVASVPNPYAKSKRKQNPAVCHDARSEFMRW
jgi:hypothetical protein